MTVSSLPTLNAALNLLATLFLTLGFVNIKTGRVRQHKKFMLFALITSGFFLISYVIYHATSGSTPYPYYNWTRVLYFAILIPHIILAALMTPFIIIMVLKALKGMFAQHKSLARWVWPVWMYVSISGVLVYLMLYQL